MFLTKAFASPTEAETSLQHRELDQCRRQLDRLRHEFALEREHSVREAELAAESALEAFMQQFVAPLANLGAMQARHEHHGDVPVQDIFRVVATLELLLFERGLERIGMAGSEEPFDATLHQMIEGSSPAAHEPVLIRFSGYRFRGKMLSKARASLSVKTAKE